LDTFALATSPLTHELTPAYLISAIADAEQFQKVVKIGSMAATYKMP
jgi:hypothetical protein